MRNADGLAKRESDQASSVTEYDNCLFIIIYHFFFFFFFVKDMMN